MEGKEGEMFIPSSVDCNSSVLRGFNAFRISTGKSATPIIRLLIVPINADAPPVIGSQGPSSASYSRGRYLNDEKY